MASIHSVELEVCVDRELRDRCNRLLTENMILQHKLMLLRFELNKQNGEKDVG